MQSGGLQIAVIILCVYLCINTFLQNYMNIGDRNVSLADLKYCENERH